MKRALIVGIDRYDSYPPLAGCVRDAEALEPLLSNNEDGSPNFECRALTTAEGDVERKDLLEAIDDLFQPGADVALLYFAGHGAAADDDVTLVTQEGTGVDPGIPLSNVMARIQRSPVPEIVLVLDCCFSGGAGGVPQLGGNLAVLRQGVSLLPASRADQPAAETDDARGLFSSSLCAALEGGAADVVGKVTLAGLYAYLSESMGAWQQRPMLKANVDRLNELRSCSPKVPLAALRRLPEFFGKLDKDQEFPLDPTFEPEAKRNNPEHEAIFALLQQCRAANLVEPVGAEHMYFAAMNSKSCRLTPLGKHYWRMAKQKRL